MEWGVSMCNGEISMWNGHFSYHRYYNRGHNQQCALVADLMERGVFGDTSTWNGEHMWDEEASVLASLVGSLAGLKARTS